LAPLSKLDLDAYIGRPNLFPIGPIFRTAREIHLSWPGIDDISDEDTVKIFKGILKQCQSVVKLSVSRFVKTQFTQAVHECRAAADGLRSLQRVELGMEDVITFSEDGSL
jgi:hypothetical protein